MDIQGEITVVGLGPGASDHLSIETMRALKKADKVILRTAVHPSVIVLDKENIKYIACDKYYQQEDFQKVYQSIVDFCLENAQNQKIVYAVPGSPMVAEQTVVLLRQKAKDAKIKVTFLPALSFLELVFTQLELDPVNGFTIVDALNLESLEQTGNLPLLITQVYDKHIASELKLSLMDKYPDEHQVVFMRNLGMANQEIIKVPLFELDRQKNIDHLTSLYVPPVTNGQMDIMPLIKTVKTLRAPNGCPWDRQQHHQSLRRFLIEEVYEVIEAIDNKDAKALCEELGDLLLQIALHSTIAEEDGLFNVQDVVDSINDKMVRRHPHVFGTVQVKDATEVLKNWEQLKKEEYTDRKNILDGIYQGLPALIRANKLQAKVAKVGFDWSDIKDVWLKVAEEINELKEAIDLKDKESIEHELGDILFAVVNLGRHISCEAETALNKTNNRFIKRFSFVEKSVQKSEKPWSDFTLEDLDDFWREAKTKEKNK